MFKQHLFTIYIFLKGVFMPCACDEQQNNYQEKHGNRKIQIKRIGKLSPVVNESSGLIVADSNSFWTLNDSDGQPSLYRIDHNGKFLDSLPIPNAENIDWEALTSDNHGNIYIGDIGNNTIKRKNLVIYKYNLETANTEQIVYNYPIQPEANNSSNSNRTDAEALIWHHDSLYIFTKHWKSKMVKLYRLPSIPGTYEPKLIDSIFISSPVTDAAISPDGRQLGILTYGKIFIFNAENGLNLSKPLRCIRFGRSGQAEGIAVTDHIDWFVTNENRKLFRVKLK